MSIIIECAMYIYPMVINYISNQIFLFININSHVIILHFYFIVLKYICIVFHFYFIVLKCQEHVVHAHIMHLATLPYQSILLCLDMQCSAQDCKRALLLAELHFEGTFTRVIVL